MNHYKTDYKTLLMQAKSLLSKKQNCISALANISALLFDGIDGINWLGFYLKDGEKLFLAPFQGKVACTEIPMGKGVCGSAAAEMKTLIVPNVHEFEGHIACDGASNSEIVIPLIKGGECLGVLDIDSPVFDRFSALDGDELGKIADMIVEYISF